MLTKLQVRIVEGLKTGFRWIPTILGKSFWNGLGAIAMIIVAISIFMLGQQIEKSRYEQNIANIYLADFDVVTPYEYKILDDNQQFSTIHIMERAKNASGEQHETAESNKWLVIMMFVNAGPAPSNTLSIEFISGGKGIKPIGQPKIFSYLSKATIVDKGSTSLLPSETDAGAYEAYYDVLIDNLFIDYDFFVVQEFYVEDSVDMELRASNTYRFCHWRFHNVNISGYTISDLDSSMDCQYYGRFIQEIKLKGYQTKQQWLWEYPSPIPQHGEGPLEIR